MTRSLMTGITGLRTHQQKLDVVANNLANMNTIAFKSQATQFSDLMYNTVRQGSSSETTGGVNPQSIGTGVQMAQISRHFSQGALQATGEILDFAIQGEGFFAVKGPTGESLFTRAGSFGLDGEGRLVDPATGNFVQRAGVSGEGLDGGVRFQEPNDDTIRIPLGVSIPGQATENLNISGNLPSASQPPSAEVLASFSPFETSAGPATGATLLSDLTINQIDYGPGDEIQLSGTNLDGSPYNGTLNADGATLDDLVNELNNLLADSTAEVRADGSIAITADDVGEGFLSLIMSDESANTGRSSFASNAMVVESNGYDGDALELSMDVYDLRGESHRITLEFSKVSANSWDINASMNADSGVFLDDSVMNLTFNEDGSYALVGGSGDGDPNIEIKFDSVQTPQLINLDFQQLSHLAAEYAAVQSQDGFPVGNLVSVSVTSEGELSGLASNGRTMPLAQLAMASFRNVGALEAVGANYFRESSNSGAASIGTGLSGGRGQVHSGQLESSNVDIAQEFTQLIVAQRGFSANARTITVSDEMLEELTNIVR